MIDSHCHLDFKQYDNNRDEVIKAAIDAGVHTIINIGTDIGTSEFSVALAQKHDSVFATVGIHPHDASSVNDRALDRLSELAKHPKVIGIGEIGLDFYRDRSPRPVQKKAFEQQLKLAVKLKLPIVIHTRDSFDETVEIVNDYANDLAGGVFHCFPGTTDEANLVIDLGFHISVGGIITFPKANMATTVKEVSLDKIIIETDAPFLTPVPYRGKTNHPSYVRYVRDKLAELKGMPSSEVEKITDRNCQKLFRLVETFGD